jgi:hypothetical protein
MLCCCSGVSRLHHTFAWREDRPARRSSLEVSKQYAHTVGGDYSQPPQC